MSNRPKNGLVAFFGDLYKIKLLGICNILTSSPISVPRPVRVMTSSNYPSHNYIAYVFKNQSTESTDGNDVL